MDHFDGESADLADFCPILNVLQDGMAGHTKKRGFGWPWIFMGQRNRYWDVYLTLKLMIMTFFALYSRRDFVQCICTEVSSGTEKSLTENLSRE